MDGVTPRASMVPEAEAFPLAVRSGGSFLEADTPKAPIPGSASDYFANTIVHSHLASSNLSNQTGRPSSLPISPLYFSPSKSYSDAISASTNLSLKNYFSVDGRVEVAGELDAVIGGSPTAGALDLTFLDTLRHQHQQQQLQQRQQQLQHQHLLVPQQNRENDMGRIMYQIRATPTGLISSPAQTPPPRPTSTTKDRSHLGLLNSLAPIKTYKFTGSPGASLVEVTNAEAENLDKGSVKDSLPKKDPQNETLSPFSCLLAAHTGPLDFSAGPSNVEDPHPDRLKALGKDPKLTGGSLRAGEEASDSAHATSFIGGAGLDVAQTIARSGFALEGVSEECGSMAVAGNKRKRQESCALDTESETSSGNDNGLENEDEYSGDELAEAHQEEEEEEEEEEEDSEDFDEVVKRKKTTKAPKIRTGGGGVKANRMTCKNCSTTNTPQWREGPEGARTLCNACGLRFRKGLPLPYWDK